MSDKITEPTMPFPPEMFAVTKEFLKFFNNPKTVAKAIGDYEAAAHRLKRATAEFVRRSRAHRGVQGARR